MARRLAPFLIAMAVLPASIPVAAQSPDADVGVRLTSFAPWAALDRPLSLGLEVANAGQVPLEDVRVRLTIHERVRNRSSLRASLNGRPLGDVLAVTTEGLDHPVAPGGVAALSIQRDLAPLATAFRAGRAQSGVYPIEIRVQAGGRTKTRRFGAFVFLAVPPETPLNLVWVVPIHRPIASDAQGAYDRSALARDLLEDGVVRRTVEILAAHPASPLTLAPTGVLLDQLADVSDGFASKTSPGRLEQVGPEDPLARAAAELLGAFRSAAAAPAFELATTPYARADLISLVAAGLRLDAGRQITVGRRRVSELLGRDPTASLLVSARHRADSRTAPSLGALGVQRLILTPSTLPGRREQRFGPDRPVEVTGAAGARFQALLVDPPVQERLQGPTDDPVLTAQAVLAETAAAFFELPALAGERLIVLGTETLPRPTVARPLLDALAQAPWIRMRTASAAADALPPQEEPRPLELDTRAAPEHLAQAGAARRMVDRLDRVVESPEAEIERLDRLVLASESADFRGTPGLGSALARAARGRAERTLAQIRVPSRQVTLTSRAGRLPVTVLNDTGYTVRLRVRLDSAKVAFPSGASRTIRMDGKLQTLTFALEARAAGSFPIVVNLETPDGEDVIGTGQVIVRSTAVSAVTLMVISGGALFLLGAWVRRALTRRRP